MFGILMALFSRVFFAGANILDAYIAENTFKKLSTLIFYAGITNIVAIPIILCFGTPKFMPLDSTFTIIMLVIAFFEVLYQFPYYKALKMVDTSIVTAMFSLGKVLIPILAYFMIDEKLNAYQYFGFFVVLFANIILNLDFSKINKKDFLGQSFLLMFYVSVVFALINVLSKKLLIEVDWITFSFWLAVYSTIMCFFMAITKKNRADIVENFGLYKQKWHTFMVMELFFQIANLFNTVALVYLPVVAVAAFGATQPIFVLFMGLLLQKICGNLFREAVDAKNMLKKMTCYIVIITGVVLTVW